MQEYLGRKGRRPRVRCRMANPSPAAVLLFDEVAHPFQINSLDIRRNDIRAVGKSDWAPRGATPPVRRASRIRRGIRFIAGELSGNLRWHREIRPATVSYPIRRPALSPSGQSGAFAGTRYRSILFVCISTSGADMASHPHHCHERSGLLTRPLRLLGNHRIEQIKGICLCCVSGISSFRDAEQMCGFVHGFEHWLELLAGIVRILHEGLDPVSQVALLLSRYLRSGGVFTENILLFIKGRGLFTQLVLLLPQSHERQERLQLAGIQLTSRPRAGRLRVLLLAEPVGPAVELLAPVAGGTDGLNADILSNQCAEGSERVRSSIFIHLPCHIAVAFERGDVKESRDFVLKSRAASRVTSALLSLNKSSVCRSLTGNCAGRMPIVSGKISRKAVAMSSSVLAARLKRAARVWPISVSRLLLACFSSCCIAFTISCSCLSAD